MFSTDYQRVTGNVDTTLTQRVACVIINVSLLTLIQRLYNV